MRHRGQCRARRDEVVENGTKLGVFKTRFLRHTSLEQQAVEVLIETGDFHVTTRPIRFVSTNFV